MKRYSRLCNICKQHKFVQYYIAQWQKKYIFLLPLPYCDECAKSREGMMLYQDWINFMEAMEMKAFKNNAELS